VVRTEQVAPWVLELTMGLMRKIGKYPVLVKKDVPGLVASRLQHALWREAISLVENGIADAKSVDAVVKHSLAMMLPVLAPLENADMSGLDATLEVHHYLFPFLEHSDGPSYLLDDKVIAGELGFKTGGKGFQEWTPQEMQDLRDRVRDHLARLAASSKMVT
jgi:3-hydroxybutyryl-CoA dehydrogenase